MTGATPAVELGIDKEFEREFYVLCGERLAVVPLHVVAKLDMPVEAVCRNTSIGDCWHFRERRFEGTLSIDRVKRVVKSKLNPFVDFNVKLVRIKYSRLLRHADDNLAGWAWRWSGECPILAEQDRPKVADNTGGAEQLKSLPPSEGELRILIFSRHYRISF